MDLLADAPALAAADLWQVRLQLEQLTPIASACFELPRGSRYAQHARSSSCPSPSSP